jgi:hypothetical protein
MANLNPFVGDPTSAEVWELGYMAGFSQPEEDHFLPLSPELLTVYAAGDMAGRDDRRLLPSGEVGEDAEGAKWAELGEGAVEFGFTHAIGEGLVHLGLRAGGLIMLVFDVIQIPGDVSFRALEPDFEGPVDQPADSYLCVCARTDHAMEPDGVVTDDGYFVGLEHRTFREAAADKRRHQHPEAVIVRCSTDDNTCGAVWPIQ